MRVGQNRTGGADELERIIAPPGGQSSVAVNPGDDDTWSMSPLDRTISGEVLVRHLPRDEQTIDQTLVARHGRSARTLVKEGPLRLTVMALAPGGGLLAHNTDGPVSIHVLEGEIVFEALAQKYPLSVGDLLVLAAGVEHSASSASGCVFLLTVVHTPSSSARV